ncbi:hypothetical protein CsSME_00054294 [Camellia sinensis var. sinensis]|uniref:plastid division protein CDP1, chloroplastic isoform X1 n=1 Tax=Camellia sinensis TaxID=4442 RepID=UPI001036E51B|nr:plastid division protein CDP1, chloroplastic isoform X1 [Camellia sinensis]
MNVCMMALLVSHLVPSVTANCLCGNNLCSSSDHNHYNYHYHYRVSVDYSLETIYFFRKTNKKRLGQQFCSRVQEALSLRRRRGLLAVARSRLNSADLRIVDTTTTNNNHNHTSSSSSNNSDTQTRTLDIPVTCYQIVGVRYQAEKDEIVKSVMDLKNAEIEEGYTADAVVSRQNLLLDVRDKLLFEPEYAGNIREKVPPKTPLRIPWAWLPGALCLLQEVGEEKLVLDIGQSTLQHPDAKPYIHDLLLSMALAEVRQSCAIATVSFEKNNISHGFEALARAQCLLRSKISLGKMKLLSQIEESLEELAPACTLELLGKPCTPENAERRLGAIAALRELLRQGLDAEAPCQVQDWPCFLSQALNKLMATEIVNLLPWDNLAVTRKNKKSLESQNQRVVIDFISFYMALTAHIALGFSSKQTDLITKARTICECLISSEGIDLKYEEAFCLFLLGQADEAEVVGRLQQLELNSDPASQNSIVGKDVSRANKSLETWLKNNVLSLFPDTRDCSPSLVNFFSGEKKASGNRQIRGSLQTMSSISLRPLSPAPASDRRALDLSYTNSSQHLGPAVKQLAPSNLQGTLMADKNNNESNISMASVQLKRNLGADNHKIWKSWLEFYNVVGRITFVMALGCILFATCKLSALQLWRVRCSTRSASGKPGIDTSSHAWTLDSSLDRNLGPDCIKRNSVAYKLKKLLSMFTMWLGNHPDAANLQNSCLAASLSSSMTAVYKRPMPMEEAESLVKQWQIIKAEALGPSYKVHSLFQVLDGPMLIQWQALADAAKARSCFWRFVLLQLSVIRAEIFSDGIGGELAEIEALLEEAAELVDESQLKNPNYYSMYRIHYVLKRQDDDSWRFCEVDIQTS